jgi:hypothetical protein
MSKYRVSCNLRCDKDWSKVLPVCEEGPHPDLAKQKIEDKYPGYTMLNIHIEDLTPVSKPWNAEPDRSGAKPKYTKEPKRLDLDRTWRKELAR